MNNWFVIVNPNSGLGEGFKKWEQIKSLLEEFGIKYNFDFTKGNNDACLIAQDQISNGERNFCIAGGDGTLNEVMNAVLSQQLVPSNEITISMIPVGTGNDWCRTFGITNNIKKNIKLLIDGKRQTQDVGKANYYFNNIEQKRYFANIAGLGFDALVAKKTNEDKKNNKTGKLLYFKNLVNSLLLYKSVKCSITYDGGKFETKLFSLSVGKGNFNGGGMKQLPFAVFDDGFLDVTLIKDMNIMEVVSNVGKLYKGTHIEHPKVETFKTTKLVIESEKKLFLELDGESVGYSPFLFEIVPKALSIISPL